MSAGQATGGFDPSRHGFGFRNWSTAQMPFEPPPVEEPTRATIRNRIRSNWRSNAARILDLDFSVVPSALTDAIGTQVRTALTRRSGTNGHCYGISLAAQRYYERPGLIPLDRDRASEFVDPTEPLEDPVDAPVYEEIVRLQAAQFLRFRSWLGRRLMLFPDRIDYETQVGTLRAVLDRHGTASISLFEGPFSGHQVLAYDVVEDGDEVTIPVYDPNWPAEGYDQSLREVRLERTDDGLTMLPYADRYDQFLFNRFDRIEAVTDRESPLEFVGVDAETAVESLFPLLVVTADSTDVEIQINGPAGRPLERIVVPFMDAGRGSVGRIRSRHGARRGTYRITLTGVRDADYELEAIAATPDARLLNRSTTGSIGPGEVHVYEATLPDGDQRGGELERTGGNRSWLPVAGGVAGGAVLGAAAYRQYQQHNNPEQ